jgi:hypothetical protein
MAMFQCLDSNQEPCTLEDDLVYAMNEFTAQLVQSGKETNATWLWTKCLELCQDRSALVCYSYSRSVRLPAAVLITAIDISSRLERSLPPLVRWSEQFEWTLPSSWPGKGSRT